jgi:hypothetical protein
MRMWMADPKKMCRQHLLGEHLECHMFAGSMRKGLKIDGYIKNNFLEPASLKKRHDELAEEMKRRGYKHRSPLQKFSMKKYKKFERVRINRLSSKRDLLRRCKKCRKRF